MQAFWRNHWFLTTLALLIATGMTLGLSGYQPSVAPVLGRLNPRWVTACVLFLMAFSLDSDHLTAAFRAPLPVLLAMLVNYVFVPLAGWGLMPLQGTDDFRVGLMIVASVPCTTAAASVMTRKARGNDAISLLASIATNGLCFLLTPLWLQWTTASKVDLDPTKMMLELAVAVLLPSIAGQLLRQPGRGHAFAVRHKTGIGVTAQVLIELMVLSAALAAGDALRAAGTVSATIRAGESTLAAAALSWGTCLAIHLGALGAGWWLARRTGHTRAEAAAVGFAGSQKTLPIGLYVAGLFAAELPFAMFPMLLYHTSQLFLDTWLASRMAAKAPEGS